MIGVLVASKLEWKTLLEVYNIDDSNLEKYPYGEFYRTIFNGKDIVYFRSGIRKINAACATQYMIDRFDLEKIIVVGTCAAVNDSYNYLDVLVDGQFKIKLFDPRLKWRGSSNQRVIDVKKSLKKGEVVLLEGTEELNNF